MEIKWQAEESRAIQEVDRNWSVVKKDAKEVEQLGTGGEVRMTTVREGPPVALPRKLQQPHTKANLPGP